MKIAEAQILMTATHQLREEQVHEESLQLWVGDRPPAEPDDGPLTAPVVFSEAIADTFSLSSEAQNLHRQAAKKPPADSADFEENSPVQDPKLLAMQRIIEMLTGKRITIGRMGKLEATSVQEPTQHQEQEGPERVGWGLAYDATTSRTEQEETLFAASGTIITTDGRQIAFDLQLAMQRQYSETSTISIRAGDARLVDPLVINFDGTAAELSDLKFEFDLDGDGQTEDMPFVAAGKGFLVLDKNNDGKINNGGELFGPKTGNGFSELAAFDRDNNGWLDEADPMFQELRIWTKDAAGSDYLWSLQDKGIGALLLTGADSPFSLKNATNELQGAIRETSLFVREDGSPGTIQEIDIAV